MGDHDDFLRHLKDATALEPVYTLVSEEPVLLDDAIAALRQRALAGAMAPDFNRDELRAGETPITRALDAAGTLPMMAPRRWVWLCDIERLKAKDLEPLLGYVKAPAPTTVLCLTGHKLDRRTTAGQRLAKATAFFQLAPPRQHELPGWIRRRAKERGIAIEPDAASLLADLVGSDLGPLDRHLDKLWTYLGGAGTITPEDVEVCVVPTRVASIFELTDAIGDRDLTKALALMRNTIDSGEAGLRVLAMVARQLRLMLRVHQLGGRASPAEIARSVGVAPFVARSLASQARRYRTSELCAGIAACADADQRMKSTRLAPGVVLDRLLLDVMG